jgi:hypothetical protein
MTTSGPPVVQPESHKLSRIRWAKTPIDPGQVDLKAKLMSQLRVYAMASDRQPTLCFITHSLSLKVSRSGIHNSVRGVAVDPYRLS